MKNYLLTLGLLLAAANIATAATNDLTASLQKGLFEEEANHNLEAAMQAYQSVATQFDRDRKLAATAIFRLGECYRKLGQTNEANARYERILREFGDQAPLVALSRQYLGGAGSPNSAANTQIGATEATAAKAEAVTLKIQIDRLTKLPQPERRIAVQQQFPNPVLTGLMEQLAKAEQSVAAAEKDYGSRHSEVIKAKTLADTISKQVDAQVQGVLSGLTIRLEAATAQSAAQPDGASSHSNLAVVPISGRAGETAEVDRLQKLLQDSPDLVNELDETGATRLQAAASRGQVTLAKFLLTHGADIEGKNRRGGYRTALVAAAASGHKAMVELLLEHHANLQATDDPAGYTALHHAAENGFRNIVELLLDHGAAVNATAARKETPLQLAAANGSRAVVELLLARGASLDANAIPYVSGENYDGTALHIAAQRGDQAVTEMLLNHHAKVNVLNKSGLTPLHLAAANGNTVVAGMLLTHGAEVDARSSGANTRDWTPLISAIDRSQSSLVGLLLTNGAAPNTSFALGSPGRPSTPLLLAIQRNRPDIVSQLLKYKADPNLKNGTEDFPLWSALASDPEVRLTIVQALLDAGADVDQRAGSGTTPLMRAAGLDDTATLALLLSHQAQVNAKDSSGSTALHYAARAISRGITKVVENGAKLIAAGADVNMGDSWGFTPLTLFTKHAVPTAPGANSFIKLLREHGALEDSPQLDVLQVRGAANHSSLLTLLKGTNDWNQFTALEVLAMAYGLLAQVPQGEQEQTFPADLLARRFGLPFPNFSRLILKHPDTSGTSWENHTLDISGVFQAGDCGVDVHMAWGDIVEVAEADHPLNDLWPGFSQSQFENLAKCLAREVKIVIKGQSTALKLRIGFPPDLPGVNSSIPLPGGPGASALQVTAKVPFWIKPVLRSSHLLLASSDLHHIKVTRRDPDGGTPREWVLDCSDDQSAPAFWLRDGDVIEVPDKQ